MRHQAGATPAWLVFTHFFNGGQQNAGRSIVAGLRLAAE
jgi:hypothetical protein